MNSANVALPRLLLQFLLVVSFIVSLGYVPSAWAASYTLTVQASPSSGGTVSKSPSLSSYSSGSKVTLTATPKAGYKFSSWTGCSSSTTSCNLTMTKNSSVTANFIALPKYTLSASASPSTGGSVSPSSGSYTSGTVVTLTATPKGGYKFSSWSGCSSSTASCKVTMTKNTTVKANFVVLPPVPQAPTLNSPANGKTNVSQSNVLFSWSVANATAAQINNYRIVISQDSSFSGFKDTGTDTSSCSGTCFTITTGTKTSYTKSMDLAGKTYYWKVRANGSSGASSWSVTRSFTTAGSSLGAKVDSFVTKWTGKPVDFDGAYGYQCVDLMRRYATDILGLNSELPTGNAYDIFAKTTSSKFLKIYNTPTGIPAKGDIIFWNKASANGNAGHVAIFISGNTSSFTSFDQNLCSNSGSGVGTCAPRLVTHDYVSSGGVVGWLHPK